MHQSEDILEVTNSYEKEIIVSFIWNKNMPGSDNFQNRQDFSIQAKIAKNFYFRTLFKAWYKQDFGLFRLHCTW